MNLWSWGLPKSQLEIEDYHDKERGDKIGLHTMFHMFFFVY